MPTEIEQTPKTITTRLRDWVGELVSYVEVSAASVLALGISSIKTRFSTDQNTKSVQVLNDGLAKAVQIHREAKSLISEGDQDEMDLFEVFKGAALAQTRLMGEAIAQGISPQPLDRAALERPTKCSSSSEHESLPGEPIGANEGREIPHHRPMPKTKRSPGRPPKESAQNETPRAAKEETTKEGQPPEQTPKRKRGRPRKDA